ncbi:YbhB/YbcL family Raf kinase inhibitor-like protein [Gloeothece verrucosa]|uniref:PEBP family protein n=1 Tax=Gloeothece verrucosa (strain PCC 7822) TaxID=497965 RepID=E0UBC9_GLOV7|nr:YbhB/YbcL family Raf kinase inhibitor-like protein [Gloeothece verrucosa]ADN12761.1 PEBP family protein [Gloeothece verrucosa PCC 7822]
MKRRVFLQKKVFSALGLFLFACNSNSSNSALSSTNKMKLESTAFRANELIPSLYTCDGQDISPALSWDEPPAGTKSLALICDDPDAPFKTWVHWVVYNLPPTSRSLPENVPSGDALPNGGVQGINDFKKVAYGGPCPPKGTHRYFFKLYALDTLLDLKAKATKAQLEAAMAGHVLASAELIGIYRRS